jgi:predicted ATP-grasp superfamily ATP-dependent carboligase
LRTFCGRPDYAGQMDHVEFLERVSLNRPPIICAFKGWNDGGEAASVAARYLVERWDARKVAVLDPEEFYDFQVTRPTVRLEGGVSRVIEWPVGEFWAANVGGKDVLLFLASEPNVRWKAFARSVIGAAVQLGSQLLVTLGAFLTDVPHARPVPVVGSAADEETARRLGMSRSQYEGPTGIVGVLHDFSIREGLPSISIWAAVPHYLPAAPNPKAALALVLRVSDVLGVEVPTEALRGAVGAWEHGVAQLIAESDELAEYVSRLESATDDTVGDIRMPDQSVPSGDAIAAELERFLREQGGGNEGT